MQESSKKSVLRVVSQSDAIEEAENSEDVSTSASPSWSMQLLN